MGLGEWADRHQFDGAFEGVSVNGDKLKKGWSSWNVAGCEASVDHGAAIAARMTATRVAVGTVLLPGVGTILGALAKKDRNKVFLAIATPDGDLVTVETKAKNEGKARAFAQKVNAASAHFGGGPARATAPTASAPAATDGLEQIKKLAELHAAGALTDEEFATKKAEILARL